MAECPVAAASAVVSSQYIVQARCCKIVDKMFPNSAENRLLGVSHAANLWDCSLGEMANAINLLK